MKRRKKKGTQNEKKQEIYQKNSANISILKLTSEAWK